MKKLFALILLFITLQSQAQYPVTQYMGSSNVVVKSRGGLGTDSTFTFATSYSDTSALNRGFLKNIPGVMARVGDNLYLRSALADRWILLGSTNGGVNIYNSNGTLTGNRTLSGGNFQMDMTGFSDFNIVSNGGIGLSYDDGIYGSGTITHNTGAVGFDISHLAAGESSIMNFGTGFLKLATDNSYVRVDQTDVKVSTASLQLLNIPRLGMIGKRVLVKDTITNQVSEVAIDSLGGGGTQTLQTVTNNGDSTTNKIITNDTLKAKSGVIKGALIVGDTVASNKIWVAFGNSVTVYSGLTETQGYVYIASRLMGWSYYNRGIAGTTMSQYSAGDSSAINRLYLIPTYSSLYSFISCEYGLNDANLHGTDTATYRASINRWIDTCIARGWPLSRILIIGPSLATKTTYLPGRYYALVGVDAANKKGVLSTNMWDSLYARGGGNNSLVGIDSIHPTALGHYNMAQVIYNTAYSFPRVGNFILNGGATIKDTIGALNGIRTLEYSPSTSLTFKNFFGGKSIFGNHVYIQQTVDNDNAPLNVGTSANQVGLSLWEGSTKYTRVYGGRIDVSEVGVSGTYLAPGVLNIASSDISFIGGSGYEHFFVGRFGGVVVNGQGISNGYLKVKGSLNKGYLLYASPDSNRVGINDSLPQQRLSVRGSGSFTDTLWGKGAVKFDGLTSSVGNKALRINTATGMISYADTTTSGGGSVTSVSGTTNRITSTGGTTPVIDISASYVGQSSITTTGTVTSGGLGTGATLGGVTPSLGSDATGDLYYRNSGGVLTRLPIGTSKQTLHVVGGIPAWRDTTAAGSSSGTNLYVRINKTLSDSTANAPNDSTLILKSIDIVSSDSTIKVTKTITDTTLKYSLTLRTDTCALVSFAGGGANAGDTTAFTTSTIYGSFFNSLSDTLVITNLRIGLQGTSPSVGVTVYWNDSLAVTAGATKLVNAGSTATNIYTGTSVTSFDNTKIPPGVWVWVQTTTVTTKPTYMTATLIGYKKRTQ